MEAGFFINNVTMETRPIRKQNITQTAADWVEMMHQSVGMCGGSAGGKSRKLCSFHFGPLKSQFCDLSGTYGVCRPEDSEQKLWFSCYLQSSLLQVNVNRKHPDILWSSIFMVTWSPWHPNPNLTPTSRRRTPPFILQLYLIKDLWSKSIHST